MVSDSKSNLVSRFGEYAKTGGPGRPRGSVGGRSKILAALDEVLAKSGNVRAFKKACEGEFKQNPMRFFHRYVMPLLPKDMRLDVSDGELRLSWKPLSTISPTQDSGPCIEAVPDSGSLAAGVDSARPSAFPPT